MTSPTELLVRTVVRAELSNLDAAVWQRAKWVVLDAFACMLAGVDTRLGRTVIEQAGSVSAGVGATVVDGTRTSVPMAAWANSSLQNLLDYDDTFAGFAHIGNTAVPKHSRTPHGMASKHVGLRHSHKTAR